MLASKRKRARKACTPCHQRKRKCNAEYPCSMCTTYGYNCTYGDAGAQPNDVTFGSGGSVARPSVVAPHGAADRDNRVRRSSGGERSPSRPSLIARTAPLSSADEARPKRAGSAAAMAFPHVLGKALGSDSPPEVHSFAYNFGTRPEESSQIHDQLGRLIAEDDLRYYSDLYFSGLAPVGDLIDPRIYAQRCRAYYHGEGTAIAFGAVAAGIAALGSFLATSRHPQESELVRYAKTILEDPASMRALSIDHVLAWALRVFYLRATTRPSNAWLASCTAMHLCESVGLHEEEQISRLAAAAGAAALGHDADRLRRIFWISWAGHTILSYEYDRSSVSLRTVSCRPILPVAGSVAHQFVQIAQMIPAPNSPFRLDPTPSTPHADLWERLKVLDDLSFTEPFLVVTQADLAFCFYRRMYQLQMGVPDDFVRRVIHCGNQAMEAAEQLVTHGRLFWNAIGSVFQYVCVLLAINTPTASIHLPAALRGLQSLTKVVDTPLTREAWSIAQHLLRLSMARKRKELAQLEPFEASAQPSSDAEMTTTTVPDFSADSDWDWDPFLIEPYLSIFDQDI